MKTQAELEAEVVASHIFTAADAARAMGHPVHPSLHERTICVIVWRNGHVIVGDGKNDAHAYAHAMWQLQEADAMVSRAMSGLSEPLRGQIRAELAGVPVGRTDVTPAAMPALSAPPENFQVARAVVFSDIGIDGLPIDDAEVWEKMREEIAKCDPAFPMSFIGYHYSLDEERVTGFLTVYA